MSQEQRLSAIREIEKARGSRVICYLTGDRQGNETRIGMDIFPFFYDTLVRIGKQKQIDLFLYSTGGATMAAWGLVNLIREFAARLCVLVPFKAQSSATLIALGADEIVMTRMGQLSPVDPTITSPFNPVLPNQPPGAQPQFLPVSVEDVSSYLDLAKEWGLDDKNVLATIFGTLAADVRPLALGSVYRAKQQIKMLSEKLLSFHMGADDREQINGIVSKLVRELYSHDYLIGRSEAKKVIGLKIVDIAESLEKQLVELFRLYSDTMELTIPYNPDILLGGDTTRTAKFEQGFIESADVSYSFITRKEVKRIKVTQQGLQMEGFQERVLEQGWTQVRPTQPKRHEMSWPRFMEARRLWTGTAGLSSASQLVNGTATRSVKVGNDTARSGRKIERQLWPVEFQPTLRERKEIELVPERKSRSLKNLSSKARSKR